MWRQPPRLSAAQGAASWVQFYCVALQVLTVFAIEKIAHGLATGGVGAFVGFQRIARRLPRGFSFAAVRAAVGEAGLAGLEFEFLSAN